MASPVAGAARPSAGDQGHVRLAGRAPTGAAASGQGVARRRARRRLAAQAAGRKPWPPSSARRMTVRLTAIGAVCGRHTRARKMALQHGKWYGAECCGMAREALSPSWGPGGRRLASSPVSCLPMLLPASPIATTVAAHFAATLTANRDRRRHEWGTQAAKIGVRTRKTARGDSGRQV